MIFKISFIIFTNGNVQFVDINLTWKTYITKKSQLIIQWVEVINKKKWVRRVLNENIKAFIIYMDSVTSKIIIHLDKKGQIALLITKKVNISPKYLDYAIVFSKNQPRCYYNKYVLLYIQSS